jgi:TRAP-type uncharacterized transport system fused permease subunit
VLFTIVTTSLGLVAFASCLERYFLRPATWLETFLFALAAAGLFWPDWWADLPGFMIFVGVILLQKFHQPHKVTPLPGDTDTPP